MSYQLPNFSTHSKTDKTQRRDRSQTASSGIIADLKIPVLGNYLFSDWRAPAGIPVFLLQDRRDADGQIRFRVVDVAHGHHHRRWNLFKEQTMTPTDTRSSKTACFIIPGAIDAIHTPSTPGFLFTAALRPSKSMMTCFLDKLTCGRQSELG
jgi:hypothetical protein